MQFDYTSVSGLTAKRALVLPHVLPILIRAAKEGEPITYTQMAEEIEVEYGVSPDVGRMTWWGWPVGTVGMMVRDWGLGRGLMIPPLNVIVVGKLSREPGTGADEVARYFRIKGVDLDKNRKAYMTAAADEVFNYGHRNWDRVARGAGADVLTPRNAKPAVSEIPLPKPMRGSSPESAEHKALKAWAARNPAVFGDYGLYGPGENEKVLSSGDRLDAYFSNGVERLAVEVKPRASTDDELKRGVYQCIKYRAVMRAENRSVGEAPLVAAVLVCTRMPSVEVRDLLKRLHVPFLLAPRDAET